MTKDDERLSQSATRFYTLLKDSSPELLDFVSIASPTAEFPYIEPGSIVMVIPAQEGFLFDKLYLETRKEDILIVMGMVPHRHISWWSDDTIEKQMKYAIQFIKDVLNERIIFIKRKALFSRKEYYEDLRVEELKKRKSILAVYSWKGTYDRMGK